MRPIVRARDSGIGTHLVFIKSTHETKRQSKERDFADASWLTSAV